MRSKPTCAHCKEYSASVWGVIHCLLLVGMYSHLKWQYLITVKGRRTAPAKRVSYTSRGRTCYQESYCRTTSRTWKVGWWGRALFAWICQTSTWPDANWWWAYKVSINKQECIYWHTGVLKPPPRELPVKCTLLGYNAYTFCEFNEVLFTFYTQALWHTHTNTHTQARAHTQCHHYRD
jgi:hypothetical protein